jgi:phosphoribosylanthranilate isomerase
MKKIKIKVCGMRDILNIVEVAEFKPDCLGFVFYERSPRYAGGLNHTVIKALSSSTQSVGVFVNTKTEHVVETAEHYNFDILQLHGDETPEYCEELKSKYKCKMIKAFGIKSGEDFSRTSGYSDVCDYFLFDTKTELYGGSGDKFDHRLLANYRGKTPFFLSGGITLQDAETIRKNLHQSCIGIDINSGFEISPGLKNVAEVRKFIEFFQQPRIYTKEL